MTDPAQGPYKTNEGAFLEKMRRFTLESKGLIKEGDAAALARLITIYEKPDHPDPVANILPSEAKALMATQKKVYPELHLHPFFRRVADIASERWGRETQKVLEASRYLDQLELGASPSTPPDEEVLALVKQARTNPSSTPRASPTKKVAQGEPKGGDPDASTLSGVLQFLKDNW